MKVGDKVLVLCEVAMVYNNESLYIDIRHDGAVFEAKRSDCRPVEPDQDDHPVEFKVGDRVVSWSGRQGVVEAINEIEGFPITVRHSMREQVSYKLGGVKHDDHPVEPAGPSKVTDSSSEPLRDAFEDWMAPKYDWDQSYFGRNENRYFDSQIELIWQAFQAGVKYQPSPLAPSPCMDGVDVDQFIEGVIEARGRTSEPLQVGDAVVVVERSHKWRGVRGRIVSVSESNEYPLEFISDCRKRLGYFRLSSIRKIDKADPVNPSHYKQGGIECIEAIKAATGDGFISYVWGNVLKYLWRWPKKGGVDDLKKARWYLDRLIKEAGE
jgi:hypothetical protein